MTSPQRSPHPESRNDIGMPLCTVEFVACCDVQLAEVVGTVIGQGVALELSPKVFHRVHVWRVRRQERNLNVTVQTVQILAYQSTVVCLQAIPEHQQRLPQMGLVRLDEMDDLLFLEAALVQPEQIAGGCQPSDNRHMVPVEMKLENGGLSIGSPGPNSGGAFADTRLVDKDDQLTFPLSFFLREGQVRRFHERTASSWRSMARLSSLKAELPRIRQTLVGQKRTPCSSSMTVSTLLSVQSSVPNPFSAGLCKIEARTAANCSSSSRTARPCSGNYGEIAVQLEYDSGWRVSNAEDIHRALRATRGQSSLHLTHVRITPASMGVLGRPTVSTAEVTRRSRQHLTGTEICRVQQV